MERFRELFESQSAGKFFRGECYVLQGGIHAIVVSDASENSKFVDYVSKPRLNAILDRVTIQQFEKMIKKEIFDKTTVDKLIKISNQV